MGTAESFGEQEPHTPSGLPKHGFPQPEQGESSGWGRGFTVFSWFFNRKRADSA
jgi:hypothetical protein